MRLRHLRTLLLAGCAAVVAGSAVSADPLLDGFRDPPNSARPRVWWHWMNGNVTQEGVDLDLAWMKRVGIGGFQNFDANLATPQVVEKRLVYMSPEWKAPISWAWKWPSPRPPAGAKPAAPGSSPRMR